MWRHLKGHFWSVAKVALRFGCAKQSKNFEWYLIFVYFLVNLSFTNFWTLPALALMFQQRSNSSNSKDSVAPLTRIPAEFTKTSNAIVKVDINGWIVLNLTKMQKTTLFIAEFLGHLFIRPINLEALLYLSTWFTVRAQL